jgi:hypothetical protein
MSISLNQILDLVGKLDDSPGDETPRERFRQFLKKSVLEVGQIRDYVEECLRISGDQYNRALQDLINHLGYFLGFEVTFGRYQGVPGQIGFDGHWKSPTGFHIVVEVKTTEVYAVKTATLVGYVDGLISEKRIPSWDNALGLYVVGRPDPEIKQIENAIVAERRTDRLRIIYVESLLSLAEIMSDYGISHEDILAVIRPSGPTIDPVVDLMARLVTEPKAGEQPELPKPEREIPSPSLDEFEPVVTDESARRPFKIKIGDTAFEQLTLPELYQQVLEFLYNGRYLSKLKLPIATGQKRYLLATEPRHPSGKDFFSCIEYKGYYMEAHKNRGQGLRDLKKLLERCGLSMEVIQY